ncbi:MAG TPA: pitrilysin family protein [Oligoflexia bacterium]|nr:pitrilysin family protein [Oligoflexia bacterium]HMR24167.1 pitrilysin family protein [Oligoflexia bacterium]
MNNQQIQAKTKLNIKDLKVNYEKFELDNGLTLLVHEDKSTPLVAVNVWYHVGSKNEVIGKTGFAHLFEHLMFNGSENFDHDYFKATEQVGATELNGTTNTDRTNYFQNVPKSALDYILWLESDRMGHLLGAIDQAKLDEQRGVVQNEKRQGENQPYGMVYEHIAKACYPSQHPYSWRTIGSMEDLNAASLEDVRTWFNTYYGAANVVIALAGNITGKEAHEKIKHYFGWIPSGPRLNKMKSWIAPMQNDKVEIIKDQVPQARLYKVWNVPGIAQDGLEELDMLSDVLSVGKNSLLYESLVEKQKLVSDVYATVWPRELGGHFLIVATAIESESLPKIEQEIDKILNDVLNKGIKKDVLEAYKTKRFAQTAERLEKIGGWGGKSDILAYYQTYYNTPDGFTQSLQRFFDLNSTKIKNVGNKWLNQGSYTLKVLPEKTYSNTKETVDRKNLPVPQSFPDLETPKHTSFTLKNGITVTYISNKTAPLFSVKIRSEQGALFDQKLGTSQLFEDLLKEAHNKYNASQLSSKLDQLGTSIHVGSDLHQANVSYSGLNVSFAETTKIVHELIQKPKYNLKSFDKAKNILIQNIKQSLNTPGAMASRTLMKIVFKDTPYAQPWSGTGTLTTVDTITLKDIEKKHEAIFKSPLHITVSSSLSKKTLEDTLNKYFGKMSITNKSPQLSTDGIEKNLPKNTLYFIHKDNSQQATIQAAALISSFNPEISPQLNIVNSILGGSFTSRINMNLREDKHWSYGARSKVSYTVGKRPLKISTSVQVDKTVESILEIYRELKNITSVKPINNNEFKAKQKDEVLSLLALFQNNDSNVEIFDDLNFKNLEYSFFEKYSAALKDLNIKTTQTLAKELINPDEFVWVVVGDKSIFDATKKKLPFKEVIYLDSVE